MYYRATGIDAYYAEVVDYLPTADNEVVSVYFKKMSSGLRIVAGDFLTEGTLSMKSAYGGVTLSSNPYSIELTPENKVYEETFAYLYYRSEWYNDKTGWNSFVSLTNIVWTKNDGTQYNYDNLSSIECPRMKMTTVNIAFYDDGTFEGASFDLKYEDIDFEEGSSYIHGDEQGDYVW